jgi:hypothetical protein
MLGHFLLIGVLVAVIALAMGIGTYFAVSHINGKDTGVLTVTKTTEQVEPNDQTEQAASEEQTEMTAQSEQSEQTETTETADYLYYGSDAQFDAAYTQASAAGYLWPTDREYLSISDLSQLEQDAVAAIRNEIYARHGYAFNTTAWQTYFGNKTWYTRDATCTEATINARLSTIERANISLIVTFEESMGWRMQQ